MGQMGGLVLVMVCFVVVVGGGLLGGGCRLLAFCLGVGVLFGCFVFSCFLSFLFFCFFYSLRQERHNDYWKGIKRKGLDFII